MSALVEAISRVRPGARRRSRARREWRRPAAIGALAALILALGYWFWFRDSGLVAVSRVKVEGIPAGSPGGAALERALERAGRKMTTLHVQQQQLERAASAFPLVRSVSADPDFPHTLSVRVVERRPAALIGSGSGATVVAADGGLLSSLSPHGLELPSLPLARAAEARAAGRHRAGPGPGPGGGSEGASALPRPQLVRQRKRGGGGASRRHRAALRNPRTGGTQVALRGGRTRRSLPDRARLCRPKLSRPARGRRGRAPASLGALSRERELRKGSPGPATRPAIRSVKPYPSPHAPSSRPSPPSLDLRVRFGKPSIGGREIWCAGCDSRH